MSPSAPSSPAQPHIDPLQSPLGRVADNRRTLSAGLPRHTHRVFASFAVVLIIEGRGHYDDALGTSRRVGAGDLIVVFPDLPHRYAPDTQWEEHYVVFAGPAFQPWVRTGLLDPHNPLLHLEPVEHWSRRLRWITADTPGPPEIHALMQVCRMQQVLAEMLAHRARDPAGRPRDQWIAAAQRLLADPDNANVALESIAHDLGIAYPTFRRRFRELVGRSPGQFRAERLIDRACRLMVDTALTDQQIADTLGFCDSFYFSRRFKQVTGQCPRQFRKTLRWNRSATSSSGTRRAAASR